MPLAKNEKDRCNTPGCKNEREIKQGKKHCPSCSSRRNRANNPVTTTYHSLKASAKRRGIPFSLTLKQWKRFCDTTGYISKRGKEPNSMQVDRKKVGPGYGYDINNIQLLTLTENTKKGQIEKRQRKGWTVSVPRSKDDPF